MRKYLLAYLTVLLCFVGLIYIANKSITVFAENKPLTVRKTVIIDAGHGGEDGGAVSCTGVLESQINLQIATKLDDLLHLLGINTVMIRTVDKDLHTSGDSIAARKNSDLNERVKLINKQNDAVLISIHQNTFTDSKYNGPQVFYGNINESVEIGKALQNNLNSTLCINNRRSSKKAEGIYLLNNVNCTSLLVECGFLSNPEEEALLRSEEYQRKLCAVISATLSSFLYS